MGERLPDARAELEAMSVEECLGCAEMLRDMKPIFATPRRRELAEETARDFERRAEAIAGRQSS